MKILHLYPNHHSKMYLLSICILSAVVFTGRAAELSSDIHDFDTLDYDTSHVHQQHRQAIRSPDVHKVELKFRALGEDFHLRLRPDNSIFSDKFVLVSSDGSKSRHVADPVHFYEGDVVGIPGSRVHGSLRDGTFQGRISHLDERYSVEPAHRYFDNATEFHSVIYKDSHVTFPESFGGGCGLNREMEERMNRRLEEAEPLEQRAEEPGVPEENHDSEDWTYRYKRQANSDRQTCDLHIITDHVYFNRYGDKNEILRQIGEHVQGANEIYKQTDFDSYTGMNFAISKITVYEADDQGNPKERVNNPFSSETIGVEKFLDITSDIAVADGEKYCLVYAFTNRDFANGVLGLAWIAETSRRSGGVCGSSYNAGIVTANNYGMNVAPLISKLTFSHELGHSLGSRHDNDGDSTCAPGGLAGNYIMYAHASSGDRRNNDEFSLCSIGSVSSVLTGLGSDRPNCLQMASEVSLCGNQIVENAEECDCGENNECGDSCCKDNCMLADTAACSPQQGPCCTPGCSFVAFTQMCAGMTECSDATFCNGLQATCPRALPRREGQTCDGGRKTCEGGDCSRSICGRNGKQEECQCSEKAQRCNLCCQNQDQSDTCAPFKPGGQEEALMLHVGSPCEDFIGYCDILLQCQIATADGPLATIFRAVFPDFDGGPEEVQLSDAVLNFFREYWWLVVISVLVLVGIMALIMFLCNFITPTDNPWKEEVVNARRNRVNLRGRRDRGSHYPTSPPTKDDGITAF